MESPPKRVTRSRAAAKVTEPAVKTTKIVTPAAKARTASTATASTRSTAAKRKTRTDDDPVDAEQQSAAKRPARGRPKKATPGVEEASAAVPTKPARGRPAKSTTLTKDDPPTARGVRGRPKKTADPHAEQSVSQEPPKPTRGRTTTTAKANPTTSTNVKTAVKKSVKFQEPDKENLEPSAKAKEPASSGLRGRPVRRAPTTAPRTTKATAKLPNETEKKPLSPKKVTQVAFSRERDESEDELAAEDNTPFLAMMKSPIRPAHNIAKEKRIAEATTNEDDESTAVINAAILNPPDLSVSVMTSPARRPPSSPLKDTLKSPARKMGAVQLPGSTMKLSSNGPDPAGSNSPTKTSLLQSAAKRPQSPIKSINFGTMAKSQGTQSAMKTSMFQSPAKRAIPGLKPSTEPRRVHSFNDSPLPNPIAFFAATTINTGRPSEKLMLEDDPADNDEAIFSESIKDLEFPGRLSAVLPRHADPTLRGETSPISSTSADTTEETITSNNSPKGEKAPEQCSTLTMVAQPASPSKVDTESEALAAEQDDISVLFVEAGKSTDIVAPVSPPNVQPASMVQNAMLQLREKDLLPSQNFDSDSEDDETAPVGLQVTPASVKCQARKSNSFEDSEHTSTSSRRSTMGFTQLANQLSAWSASSPRKSSQPTVNETKLELGPTVGGSEMASQPEGESIMSAHFFEDEMSVRPSITEESSTLEIERSANDELELDEPLLDDVLITEEDVALAEEAQEMSLLEPQEVEELVNHNQSFDDSLSDASQEYGDENQVPVDPAMMGISNQAPTTPVRPIMASFHTTTKVPLKPADNSTPSPLKKRSFSTSRVAPKRPTVMSRNATVISYSPEKESRRTSVLPSRGTTTMEPVTPGPVTPEKKDIWSTLGTPARTPRHDIDKSLLRGAIVYVDVHTSEGSDASSIFVELLGQMGARCVETWDWDPTGISRDGSGSTKVGVTHVVFKDGDDEILEKVRLANGVVHCVGVSWVLDCERENEWVDEAPYLIRTDLSKKRGGRRKTLEPGALPDPVEGSTSNSLDKAKSIPSTPMRRRDSAMWIHSPSNQEDENADAEDMEWPSTVLTPVPKTPAPEAIARYVADMVDTPSETESELSNSPAEQSLLVRTCPPKSRFQDLGEGLLKKDKDEQVLMRLMAVRRKSLQFAPKIGSPLAKTWA